MLPSCSVRTDNVLEINEEVETRRGQKLFTNAEERSADTGLWSVSERSCLISPVGRCVTSNCQVPIPEAALFVASTSHTTLIVFPEISRYKGKKHTLIMEMSRTLFCWERIRRGTADIRGLEL